MAIEESPHAEYDRGYSNGWNACAARTQTAITSESGKPASQGASAITSVEVPRLTEAQIESICRVGAVYAPDGMVKRHPIEYRRELEANARSAVRKAEAALIAKWSKT